MNVLAKYTEQSYALMRIVAGFMFSFHGMQKILGILSDFQPAFGSQVWFGGIIELTAGFLVMIGLQTRWAALLASGTMAVAYFQFHWKLQWGAEFFPAINKGELAVLYSFVFLVIACRGGGIWCLDKQLQLRAHKTEDSNTDDKLKGNRK